MSDQFYCIADANTGQPVYLTRFVQRCYNFETTYGRDNCFVNIVTEKDAENWRRKGVRYEDDD